MERVVRAEEVCWSDKSTAVHKGSATNEVASVHEAAAAHKATVVAKAAVRDKRTAAAHERTATVYEGTAIAVNERTATHPPHAAGSHHRAWTAESSVTHHPAAAPPRIPIPPPRKPPPPPWKPPPPPPCPPPPPRCAKAAGAPPSNTTAQPAATSILEVFITDLPTQRSASRSPADRVNNRRPLVEMTGHQCCPA